MWDRPRPVSAASVTVLLAVLLAGIPAPTRGACEGDNATAVALCNSLVGTVLNSPFNATRIAYVCDPEVLYSDYRCLAMGMNHTIHARPHLMETRDVAPDGRRHVVDERGAPKRLPMPFRNGDKLAKAGHPVESSERNYVLAFEMFGVMRNAMFFRGPWITDDDWRRWHGPLTDCGLDDDDVFETAKNHPDGKLGRQLNRTMVLRMIRYPMYNGGDTAAQMEHYADAALADFLCVVAPELTTDPTYASWPHRSRSSPSPSLALATEQSPDVLAERVPPLLHRPGSRARRVIGRRRAGRVARVGVLGRARQARGPRVPAHGTRARNHGKGAKGSGRGVGLGRRRAGRSLERDPGHDGRGEHGRER